jgi:hypothetical protein
MPANSSAATTAAGLPDSEQSGAAAERSRRRRRRRVRNREKRDGSGGGGGSPSPPAPAPARALWREVEWPICQRPRAWSWWRPELEMTPARPGKKTGRLSTRVGRRWVGPACWSVDQTWVGPGDGTEPPATPLFGLRDGNVPVRQFGSRAQPFYFNFKYLNNIF